MRDGRRGSTTLIFIIILGGVVFAVANVLMLTMTVKGSITVPLTGEIYRLCPSCIGYFAIAPLVVALLIAAMVYETTGGTAKSPTPDDGKAGTNAPTAPSGEAALQLLSLLQQEGRFIDFVEEEIDAYSDAQVGAAVRSIHAGCRKALHERFQLERVFAAEDGAPITVEPGFDPVSVRLTGNVAGSPPFHGVLQHGGWRVTKVSLPQPTSGVDLKIVAPAEVELS